LWLLAKTARASPFKDLAGSREQEITGVSLTQSDYAVFRRVTPKLISGKLRALADFAQAASCTDKEVTGPGLEQRGHRSVGQAFVYAVVDEAVAVEARQAFWRAEPQKSARVPDDAVNMVRCQAIGSGVSPDGQQLRLQESGESGQGGQDRSASHAASIILPF